MSDGEDIPDIQYIKIGQRAPKGQKSIKEPKDRKPKQTHGDFYQKGKRSKHNILSS